MDQPSKNAIAAVHITNIIGQKRKLKLSSTMDEDDNESESNSGSSEDEDEEAIACQSIDKYMFCICKILVVVW